MSTGTLSSTRIIIKNLPTYFNENQLKDHFVKRLQTLHKDDKDSSINSLITDIKLVKDNRTGESRRFAFIGFRNEEDAQDAVKFHNNSFIHTSKIQVNLAKSFVDPSIPTPMKLKRQEALRKLREEEEKLLQQREDEKIGKNKHKKVKLSTDIEKEVEKNKQLKEFMETMNVESNNQNKDYSTILQSNNNATNNFFSDDIKTNFDYSKLKTDAGKSADEESNDEDEGFNPLLATVQQATASTKQETSSSDEEIKPDSPENNDDLDDLEWFRSKRTFMKENEEPSNETVVKSPEELGVVDEAPEQEQESEPEESQEEKNIKKIKETGRLFVRNILYTATEDDFKTLFSKYGEIEEIHIALDTRTGKSKGYVYVLFKNPDDAVTAYIELDKQIFQGRLLHIIPGDGKKTHTLTEFDLKNMPLKKQKELKRKHEAYKSTFQWNSLYLNQDAVLESMAHKLGLEKSQLIDAESSNAAVKQALAEAAVINDVRQFFESKGVDLKNFNKQERDDTVILIKNFPFGTTIAELAELFLPFGVLKRFIMPQNGIIAILQYRDQTSARSAFQNLSYKKFKDGILYLEKGPKNCFKELEPSKKEIAELDDIMNQAAQNVEKNSIKTIDEDKVDVEKILGDAKDEDAEENEEEFTGPTTSIFVKNLNFSTSSETLKQHFSPVEGFLLAQVKTKPDPKNKNRTLSMGFGFVEFKTKQQAEIAISTLDGSVIEGHKIQLKISHRQNTVNNAKVKSNKKVSSKIIVKNLPFEAARKDIYELFSSFGQLKSVRVPKKFDKSARGFAFVEFLLPKEAESAMNQLEGVHLLGRRLVMQYAEQDAQDAEAKIEKMTNKVKKQFTSSQMASKRNATKGKFTLSDQLDGDEF
ncbi:related to Multiple RNA-binding domain-containing protein 1 [Hanseniaspora guilliermondii]|uniref:Multiple RNA-binding domain-containing protein 1 n=1 Tax=Hanseniaspora guilliermondii TaxID=56406 RepID=A0A1L0B7E9_9ASCO|nr:related to Multiple RNA-binding domain-containing protein 1 [Hanseniaspora guilliermondii]